MWSFGYVNTPRGPKGQIEWLPNWSVASMDAFHPTCAHHADLMMMAETPELLEWLVRASGPRPYVMGGRR